MSGWLHKIFGSARTKERKEEDAAPKKHVKIAVLAVDDDAEYLVAIRPVLAAHGFHVYTAASGAKGLNILAYAPENLRVLLLDYNMPGFSGVDTLQYVRRVSPDVKIIAVTGVGRDQLPEEFRNGVDKIISKPFRTDDLVAAITEAIATDALPPAPNNATD
jgi:CheY-like chemotaxis protein